MQNRFIGMKTWDTGGNQVIEPLDGSDPYDVHNYAYIRAIAGVDRQGSKDLIFQFTGYTYSLSTMEPSRTSSQFELVFHNITDLHTKPQNLVPFDGKRLEMDDFVYNYDETKEKVRIGWYGDTGTAEPDPEMEFWADTIEFKMAPTPPPATAP